MEGVYLVAYLILLVMLKPHVIGGEPVAISQAQIRTPKLLLRNSLLINPIILMPNLGVESKSSCLRMDRSASIPLAATPVIEYRARHVI